MKKNTSSATTGLLLLEKENGGGDTLSFGTKLIARDSSAVNYSRRDYYGGSAAVPFMWESIPGTPKHRLAVEPDVLQITPPPSANTKTASVSENHNSRSSLLLHDILRSIRRRTKPYFYSSYSSSSSSSTSSSPNSLPCSATAPALFSLSPTSGFCFGIRKQRGEGESPPGGAAAALSTRGER